MFDFSFFFAEFSGDVLRCAGLCWVLAVFVLVLLVPLVPVALVVLVVLGGHGCRVAEATVPALRAARPVLGIYHFGTRCVHAARRKARTPTLPTS